MRSLEVAGLGGLGVIAVFAVIIVQKSLAAGLPAIHDGELPLWRLQVPRPLCTVILQPVRMYTTLQHYRLPLAITTADLESRQGAETSSSKADKWGVNRQRTASQRPLLSWALHSTSLLWWVPVLQRVWVRLKLASVLPWA